MKKDLGYVINVNGTGRFFVPPGDEDDAPAVPGQTTHPEMAGRYTFEEAYELVHELAARYPSDQFKIGGVVLSPIPPPFRAVDPDQQARMKAAMATRARERDERAAQLPATRLEGEAALRRLLPIAQRDTGQSSVVARFLMNLYNGNRFPFDMTDFRRLDYELFEDCMAVLKMDFQLVREVHLYFEHGGTVFEALAAGWGFKDYQGENWR